MSLNEIKKQIIELKNKDLRLRDQLMQEGKLNDGYNKTMQKVHNENAAVLDDIIKKIGYPAIEKVGQEASEAAWLIIQHSISQPSLMKKCELLLKKAVAKHQASPIHLAYLSDRIAILEGKQQLYGTQFDWDKEGKMSPQEYDNLDRVNERRKSIGLNTVEEQTQLMRKQAADNNEAPPINFDKRKEEINIWRKSVGWI